MAHGHEDARRRRIVPCAGDRAEDTIRQRSCFGGGVLANGGEVRTLPLVLPFNPTRPLFLERAAEDALEVRCEVPLAAFTAVEPCEHSIVSVAKREIADEPRAIQIRIGAHLEVDGSSLRLQSHYVVYAHAVADERAEDHLVVRPYGATEPTVHPGFQIRRNPFEV